MGKPKKKKNEYQAVTPSIWGFIATNPKGRVLGSDIPKNYFDLWRSLGDSSRSIL